MSSVANSKPAASGAGFDIAANGDAALFLEMQDAYSQLEHEPLRKVLLDSLAAEKESIQAIARCFGGFLAGPQPLEVRRKFFCSYQRTNNSAMSVEGLANRISAEAEAKACGADKERAFSLFRSAGRMNRVADDDLGVGGQALHFELYYRMATAFAGGDDSWQSRQYCLPAAAEFKSWLDTCRLRSPILTGLYSLLVHEGYTHAEFETIEAPFRNWATAHLGLSDHDANRVLAWIMVHNGGTEKGHFAHSCWSLEHYLEGSGEKVDLQLAGEIFRKYFRNKGAAMTEISGTYQ